MFVLIGIRYPDNHGAGPSFFVFLFVGILLGALLICTTSKSKIIIVIICCSFSGLFITYLVDRYNIMVDYDVWIERGMPEWGNALKDNEKNESSREDPPMQNNVKQ